MAKAARCTVLLVMTVPVVLFSVPWLDCPIPSRVVKCCRIRSMMIRKRLGWVGLSWVWFGSCGRRGRYCVCVCLEVTRKVRDDKSVSNFGEAFSSAAFEHGHFGFGRQNVLVSVWMLVCLCLLHSQTPGCLFYFSGRRTEYHKRCNPEDVLRFMLRQTGASTQTDGESTGTPKQKLRQFGISLLVFAKENRPSLSLMHLHFWGDVASVSLSLCNLVSSTDPHR